MYSITVRDHILISHSLKDRVFGPAQSLHGATYVVDAEFKTNQLDEHNTVIDIGIVSKVLKQVCAGLNYQNLDDHSELSQQLTTTEYLAWYIYGEISKQVNSYFTGSLKVVLHESHIAWGSYEGDVG